MSNLILLITATLWLECGGEPHNGKVAVATVIWNRAKGDNGRIEAVILRRKQFSCWNVRKPASFRKPRNAGNAWNDCERIASKMVAGTFQPTGPWTHYFAHRKVVPYWAVTLKDVEVIGNHTFGREVR